MYQLFGIISFSLKATLVTLGMVSRFRACMVQGLVVL